MVVEDIPVFVTVRDRVTDLRGMVTWLEDAGQRNIVLLDNASTYPPCVSYLRAQGDRVTYLGANLGHHALFAADLVPEGRFFLSDPDLVFLGPHSGLQHLLDLAEMYPERDQIGFGLSLDGVPETLMHYRWEQSMWDASKEIAPGVFESPIDTTFAIYTRGSMGIWNALRTGPPHVMAHPSWLQTAENLTEENAYYLAHRDPGPWQSWW